MTKDFCLKCGKEIPKEAEFCAFCGKPKESNSENEDFYIIYIILSDILRHGFSFEAILLLTIGGVLIIAYLHSPIIGIFRIRYAWDNTSKDIPRDCSWVLNNDGVTIKTAVSQFQYEWTHFYRIIESWQCFF